METSIKNLINRFDSILKEKKLKITKQRKQILETFFSKEGHVTIDELYDIMKKINPEIGYATIHRTLKLLSNLGIAEGIKINNQKILYEHKYNHKHHDHLVCVKCNKLIEVCSDEIENIQRSLAKKNNFTILDHKFIIYGICEECKNNSKI